MSAYRFVVTDLIWHGSRYWATEPSGNEILGWNTEYLPYVVSRITRKRIIINAVTAGPLGENLYLKRDVMERDGKQYHTRFHEYFYATKPPPDKEFRFARRPAFDSYALVTLGLRQPYTRDQARSAYRRLAKTAHPDKGGTTKDFNRLKSAYDTALKFAAQ